MDVEFPVVPASRAELGAVAPPQPASSPRTRGDRRLQTVLGLSAFVASLSYFATTPFYPQMARDLQTTEPLLGQIVTLMALFGAILAWWPARH